MILLTGVELAMLSTKQWDYSDAVSGGLAAHYQLALTEIWSLE
jgi:hypothetical protein